MKAIVHTRYGPPDVLQLQEVKTPVPADNDVLIRIHATSVTAMDYRIRGSKFPRLFWLPARMNFGLFRPKAKIPGINLAGEVVSVGKNVTRFREGDQIFGSTSRGFGAYAEYICQPEDGPLAHKPVNLTYAEAAALPFGGHTSLSFLRDRGDIKSGQRVLIYGASGGVGTAAVQIAKYYGATVTGVCSTSNLELVKSLGADRVIDYTNQDFTEDSVRYDLIFETVGKSSVRHGKRLLKDEGIYLANVIGPSTLVHMLWSSKIGRKKVVGGIASVSVEDTNLLKDLAATGQLRPVIDRSYPFEQIADAHRYADEGHKKGSVVITLDHNEHGEAL